MIPAATINSHLSLLSDRGVGSIKIDRYYPKESMVGSRSAAMVQREKMANLLDNPTYRVKRARSLCRAKNDLPGKLLRLNTSIHIYYSYRTIAVLAVCRLFDSDR